MDGKTVLEILFALAGIIYTAGFIRHQINTNTTDINLLWKAVKELDIKQDGHEKLASERRLELEKTTGEIRGMMMVRDEQLKEILRRLDEIITDIKTLKN